MQTKNEFLKEKKHQRLVKYIQDLDQAQKKPLKIETNFCSYERGWVPYWDKLCKFLISLERKDIRIEKEKIKFMSYVDGSDYDEEWDEYISIREFVLGFKGDIFKVSFSECSHGMYDIREFKVVKKKVKSVDIYE